MARLSLRLLGDFEARLGSGPPLRLRARKTQALLAYLASPPGQTHSRDKLAALLWGERSQQQARSRLRGSLFVLRRALASADPPCLVLGSEGVALNADAVDVDAAAFTRLVQGDRGALARAVELYRGDLLEGLAFRGALFEDWLMAERARLRELAVDALAKILAQQRATGPAETALQTALRLLALDPLQEPVHRTLMRLYSEVGRRGAALRQYQFCVSVLQRELGVEPEAATRQLYQETLRRRPALETTTEPITEGDSLPYPALRRRPLALATDIPLIGRDEEMGRLRALLADTASGHGRVVTLVGEAGVGKTRLVAELSATVPEVSGRVLIGRGYESEQILPFGPWVDVLAAGRELVNETLLKTLPRALRQELGRLLPEFGPRDAESTAPTDYLKLFEAVEVLLGHLADRQPTVLILEDLHWADEMSLRLLAHLGHRLQDRPILLVATARQDELPEDPARRRCLEALEREPRAIRLILAPLSHAETLTLVQTLAPAGTTSAALTDLSEQIWKTSEGNPFVVVETMRALRQKQTGSAVADIHLPSAVRDAITRRLDQLTNDAKLLAAVGAVIGRDFDFRLLPRAAGLPETRAAEAFEELIRRQIFHAEGDRFGFTHDRVRDVAYSRLLAPRRRLLHREVAESLEAFYARNLGLHYLALGRHYREGEVWDKAVDFFRQAGNWAAARSASREAVACFEQALGALEHFRESPDRTRLAIDLRLDLQAGYLLLGELNPMLASLREAESLAQALSDGRRLARVWAHMVSCFWWMGDLESAVDRGRRALATATDLGDPGLEILARARLAMAYLYLGSYQQAIEVGRPCTEALSGNLARDRFGMAALPAVMVRGYLAVSLASLGDFIAASAVSEEALEIATTAHHPYSVALARFQAGRWHALQGNFSEAIPALELSLEACRREGFYVFSTVAAFLGGAYASVGRLSEGIALLQESVQRETVIEFTVHRPANLAFLAEAYLVAGRPEEALQTAYRALDLSRECKQQGFEAHALYILGEIQASQAADKARAEEFYRQALALAEPRGMRPLIAHCHLGLGKLYHRTDKREQAQEHLATATTMYREMGMTYWVEKAEAEM